ncbi:glycosyl hydrolase family 28 protein [Alistipes onderdonkii]|uniref:glycosyl hydrolase family 28 protein n=1 Tax=Alistipes onderdonkii TaxID=328813 RepID=UPI0036F1D750
MKNKIWATFAFAAIFCSASCAEDDTFAFNPDYNTQDGYTPDGIASWPQAIFCFDDNRCTEVEMAPSQAALRGIETSGNRATALAFASQDNLSFTNTSTGAHSTEYILRVEDIDAEIPAIWMQCATRQQISKGFTLKPLTSSVKVVLVNAPDTLRSVVLTLPRMTDALYIASGKTEPFGEALEKQVEVGRAGAEFNIFPMARQTAAWKLGFKVRFPNSEADGYMMLREGVAAGQTIDLEIDFSKLEEEFTYDVAYRVAAYGEQGGELTKGEFFPVLPGDDKFRDANPYYNVYVLKDRRWQTVEVRNALCSDSPNHHEEIWNDWDNSKKLRDTMCYALFTHDFADAVRVKVEKRSGFSRVAVRPSAYGIMTKESASSNTVEFTLPAYEKRKVSVEFDGDRYHNLFLMPSRPDTRKPAVSGGNVSYYGPGEHTEGIIVLTEGQTLYVDEGAVLYPQNIQVRGNGVTIAGRGVISGEKMRHWGEEFSNADVMIDVQGNKHEGGYTDFRIEGVTMIDAPSWCLRVMNTDNVAIENINMIHWDLNGDGIDLCTVTGATINDCMLRAYDDCITLKVRSNADPYGNVHDIRITNCIIWGDYARGIVVGPECGNVWWASGDIRNIEIRNCTVLEAARGQALAIMQELGDFSEAGGPALIDNVLFEDCVVDNIHSSGTPIYTSQVNKGESCEMKNVVFRNVTILDGLGCQPSRINVNNTYTSIDFDNLIYNSRKITSFGKEIVLEDTSSEPWEHTWISFK